MTIAYAIGLCLGALFSAFAISRGLLFLSRGRLTGRTGLALANSLSFVVIVGVSIFARGSLEWAAVTMHFLAQAFCLCFDLWRSSIDDRSNVA
ncbi:hypothetical protein DBIPINDM_008329 (plasmid) [Mesorhizobium sp. AR02]|uniref:hypothetical protein n=1 Tax=Mesorhizobium sp. AR02 TaxID=2865837 RepID=UPI00215F707C|nr:hypothetical protein [Mesorhizobium sp. AR02]UVK57384.1 hypothetical protein DBIPINDM_008329 [Mesorhizobium sp. AR02]